MHPHWFNWIMFTRKFTTAKHYCPCFYRQKTSWSQVSNAFFCLVCSRPWKVGALLKSAEAAVHQTWYTRLGHHICLRRENEALWPAQSLSSHAITPILEHSAVNGWSHFMSVPSKPVFLHPDPCSFSMMSHTWGPLAWFLHVRRERCCRNYLD